MQGAPKQMHTLMERINTIIYTVWSNAGELPDTVSKWHTYAMLTQVSERTGHEAVNIQPKYPRPK